MLVFQRQNQEADHCKVPVGTRAFHIAPVIPLTRTDAMYGLGLTSSHSCETDAATSLVIICLMLFVAESSYLGKVGLRVSWSTVLC
jgi:hypothetical protein